MGRSYARAGQIAVVTFGLLLIGAAAHAQGRGTPDSETPAEEEWCDGLPRAQAGLCTAYCEAMDCESENPNASEAACNTVLENYMRRSGGEPPPCFETFFGYCADNPDSNCCSEREGETGCEDLQCEEIVCENDPFCCGAEDGFWDDICVDEADEFCIGQP
jgi:hypothetical protein